MLIRCADHIRMWFETPGLVLPVPFLTQEGLVHCFNCCSSSWRAELRKVLIQYALDSSQHPQQPLHLDALLRLESLRLGCVLSVLSLQLGLHELQRVTTMKKVYDELADLPWPTWLSPFDSTLKLRGDRRRNLWK